MLLGGARKTLAKKVYLTYSSRNTCEGWGSIRCAAEMGLNVVSLYVVLPAAEVLADGGNLGLAAARSVVPPVRHTDRDVRELGLASHGVHASHTFQDGAETAEAEAGGAHVPALAAGGIVVVDRPGGGVAPH